MPRNRRSPGLLRSAARTPAASPPAGEPGSHAGLGVDRHDPVRRRQQLPVPVVRDAGAAHRDDAVHRRRRSGRTGQARGRSGGLLHRDSGPWTAAVTAPGRTDPIEAGRPAASGVSDAVPLVQDHAALGHDGRVPDRHPGLGGQALGDGDHRAGDLAVCVRRADLRAGSGPFSARPGYRLGAGAAAGARASCAAC